MMRIGMGLLALMGLGVSMSAQGQMTLPGKFEVTDTGSASYTIPISVVPGTAGLEPKLSLQYDSRSGNGLLGVGWSLAGLPAITRCGKTIAQDGVAGGINYDANDRFCLDGQRLIAINNGTYGAPNTEYRTERESFSKVVSYGTVSGGSGPSWFKVWTKAGLVMEFGNTADSKIEAQGKQSVRVWALNKTSDTKGNAFTVRYTEDGTNGEYRPDRIDYTGAEGTATNNSVRFVYDAETRPDIVPMYQAGSLIKTTKRMAKVQAWQASTLVKEYRLSYELSPETKRSRLKAAEYCGPSVCLPASTFTWQNSDLLLIRQTNIAARDGSNRPDAGWSFLPGDFNGDGLTDILVTHSSGLWDVWLNKPDGTFEVVSNLGGTNGWYGSASGWSIHLGDFNGDGRTDILVSCYDGRREVWLLAGDTAANLTLNRNHNPFAGQNGTHRPDGGWTFRPSDFNGDGLADLLVTHSSGLWEVWLNEGIAVPAAVVSNLGGNNGWYGSASGWHIYLADFNGDGRTDILVSSNDNRREVWFMAGDTAANLTVTRNYNPFAVMNGYYGPADGWNLQLGDFNGDGLADIMVSHATGRWEAWLNTNQAVPTVVVGNYGGNDGYYGSNSGWAYLLADFNGDGRSDTLVTHSSGRWEIWRTDRLVTGAVTDRITNININDGHYGWGGGSWTSYVGDFNGDGRTDLLLVCYDGRREIWTFGQPVPADAITSIQTPSGSATQLTYKSIARGGVYTKDTSATYPVLNVQGPLYVVSEVKSSNGLAIAGTGGEYRSSYRYAGAKADQHGRGFLGFRQMTVKDEQTGVEQITSYRQDYPFTGLVASREKKLGTALLNRSTNNYSSTNLGGTRRYPFLTQSLEESWELGVGGAQGAALPVVRTEYEYDNHPHPSCVTAEPLGNVTKVVVRTDPGTAQEHSKQTVNCYANDIGQWFLGRLIHSAVTSTIPGN